MDKAPLKGMSKLCIITMVFIFGLSIEANAQRVEERMRDGANQKQIAKLLLACEPSSEPLHKSFKRRSLLKLRAPKQRFLMEQRRANCRQQKAKKEQGEREQAKRRQKYLKLKYLNRVDS